VVANVQHFVRLQANELQRAQEWCRVRLVGTTVLAGDDIGKGEIIIL